MRKCLSPAPSVPTQPVQTCAANTLLFTVTLTSVFARAAAANEDVWAVLAPFDVLGQHGVPHAAKLFVYALIALHALAFAFWLFSVLCVGPSRAKTKRS